MNGHKKLIAIAAGIAAVCSILSWVGGTYNGWTRRVEASVVVQRMVNAHDETLQKMVPKVETCHGVNEMQEYRIGQNEQDIARLTRTVEQTHEMMQSYFQSMMRDGRIPR